jgi:hypothetical protein
VTEEYSVKTDVNVDSVPVTNPATEQTGVDLHATYLKDSLSYSWSVEQSGLRYEVTLYEDGNIEIEARDPARLFANSPWEEFSFQGHIRDIERGENLQGSPENDEIDLHEICDNIEDYLDPDDELEEDLEDLISKAQRTAVAWESESGEEPSKYR